MRLLDGRRRLLLLRVVRMLHRERLLRELPVQDRRLLLRERLRVLLPARLSEAR